MARPVAARSDVRASRRAQRQYRADLRRHLVAAQEAIAARDWRPAGEHLIAAAVLGEQSLIEKLREPVVRQ
jgi:hypothetical protein